VVCLCSARQGRSEIALAMPLDTVWFEDLEDLDPQTSTARQLGKTGPVPCR